MRRWNRWPSDETGSAALEFIATGIILLVPLVYLVLTLGEVQRQTLGVEAAARHTARAISQSVDADQAAIRSDAVLDGVIEEYGIDAESIAVEVVCAPLASPCPAPGATITLTVGARVSLPFVPPILGLDRAASIPVSATAVQKMSRLWGTG